MLLAIILVLLGTAFGLGLTALGANLTLRLMGAATAPASNPER